MYRIILKAYDPDGVEVFSEHECMGDSYEKCIKEVARFLHFDFKTAPAPTAGVAKSPERSGGRSRVKTAKAPASAGKVR